MLGGGRAVGGHFDVQSSIDAALLKDALLVAPVEEAGEEAEDDDDEGADDDADYGAGAEV